MMTRRKFLTAAAEMGRLRRAPQLLVHRMKPGLVTCNLASGWDLPALQLADEKGYRLFLKYYVRLFARAAG